MSAQVTRIFRFDASGCNGCDIEVLEATTLVSLGELGIEIAERSDDANLLVVTGGSNLKSKRELEIAYNAMQAPKTVVAVGSCAATMGIFKGGYSMAGPIDNIVPVDLYISGCPPRPQVILGALADALHLNVEGMAELLRTPQGFRGDPHVDEAKCVGCGACAHVCPADAIEIVGNGATRRVRFMHKDCIFCGSCQDVCPSEAVELRAGQKAWFQAKDASLSEAHLAVGHCHLCGAPYVPEAQMAWALRQLDEKLALGASERGMVERSLGICTQCRRKNIAEVREAKRVLASLARGSSA